jgi:dolichol kinase
MTDVRDIGTTYRAELVRKTIHLCSLSIPIAYAFLPRLTMLYLLIPITILFAATDAARLYVPAFGAFYHRLFGWLLRTHEREKGSGRFTGATFVLLSACISIATFPKVVAITAFSILIVSDTVAALVGRKFGTVRFFRKTVQGAAGFFVSAVIVVMLAPKVSGNPAEYLAGICGAAVGTVVESLSGSLDDNFTIPIIVGLTMWLLYGLMVPVDVFGLDGAAMLTRTEALLFAGR